ncbi:hypothetical protein ATY41_09520 [Leifsonia xyli subsp. xyli]|uniref:Uncharacterized protein n=1 Tax=Leifsonia xyli subsp. xyli TaxID=59736 RepID=A0A1E2SLQ2_LEIXY|nr:hypothetical protein ATY41_09520 [Leifsonia xyli subsp. xyli]
MDARLSGGRVPAVVTTLVFTSGAPVGGTAGVEYAFTVTAKGLGTIVFAVTFGALTAGLSLDASSGKISGIPTTPGTATFTVIASNPYESAIEKDTITIAGASRSGGRRGARRETSWDGWRFGSHGLG